MSTIQELKRKNEKLRSEIKAKQELLEIQRERTRLMKENNRLLFQQKHGKLLSAGKTAGELTSKFGQKVGRGLYKWAKVIAENQKREQRLQKRANSIKKRPSKPRRKRAKTSSKR